MSTQLARAAVWYARHGWHIFPLRPRTKEPYKGIGVYEATNDVAQIERWWRRWPESNIALHPGPSELVVLDADLYKDTYAGDSLLSMADEDTLTSLTGGGGTHLLYALPDDRHYGNHKNTLPAGIDVRCFGGYVVLPPSVHDSGNLYQWELGYRPDEMIPAPLPQFLVELLDNAAQTEAAEVTFGNVSPTPPNLYQWRISREVKRLIENPPAKGGRSEADQKVITSLVLAGATDDDILSVFEHYPIGVQGKYADKGGNGLRYLQHSVSHARAYSMPIVAERKMERAAQFMRLATR